MQIAVERDMDPHEYCQERAASSGSSFYYSFLFLPEARRRHSSIETDDPLIVIRIVAASLEAETSIRPPSGFAVETRS